jgi:long-subunit fatty acid transport protein
MKSVSSLCTILALSLCAACPVLAREGLYVRGELGRSDIDELALKDSSQLFGLDVGWRFAGNFGAELGFRDLGDYTGRSTSLRTNLKAQAFTAALSGKYQFNPEGVQGVYVDGRLGLANFDINGTEVNPNTPTQTRRYGASGSRVFFSLGLGYEMTENFGMAINYTRYRFERTLTPDSQNVGSKSEYELPALGVVAEFRF